MALVILPCDTPWWPTLVRYLRQIGEAQDSGQFVEGMLKIHNMCNVGLDPDEPDRPDQTLFEGFRRFLDEELEPEQKEHFLRHTGPAMVRRALDMKNLKPPGGLHFSLQQQGDHVELDRAFVASLLAHSFFSTYPKRSAKTHPTLQDCNFSTFFKHLTQKCQKAKLLCIWQYFDEMELDTAPTEKIIITRQVMTGREWLTIEDWLECGVPLCPVVVRHEGRIERAEGTALRICFANSRLGGAVLDDGSSMESVQFCTCPELLVVLLHVEALEDNEALTVENVANVGRISNPRRGAAMEPVSVPGGVLLTVCCLDAENYHRLPLSQFEEDNVLRELNKALLGFRQQRNADPPRGREYRNEVEVHPRRLSPIGESFSSNQSDPQSLHLRAPKTEDAPAPRSRLLPTKQPRGRSRSRSPRPPAPPSTAATRRGRFIVLGSSGECLPVSRRKIMTGMLGKLPRPRSRSRTRSPPHSSSSSEDSASEEFLSAQSSLEGDFESEAQADRGANRYSAQLDTPERRSTFAERLRDALKRETISSGSTDSSYAVGITVAGRGLGEEEIRLKRGDSRGFVLEDSMDPPDEALDEISSAHREERKKAQFRRPGALVATGRKETANSSRYSFDTDCSSDLEEKCEKFEKWLDEQEASDRTELGGRDLAVIKFAGSLLKRTLSDSFAGASLDDDKAKSESNKKPSQVEKKDFKIAQFTRSMSLELAKHKHRLASQLVSLLGTTLVGGKSAGIRAIATGNWGCGSERAGDPQLKLIVQWLAASVAGTPHLVYYTCSHHKLLKLDTVCRVVLDRRWTVGELTRAALEFAQLSLDPPSPPIAGQSLFDALLMSKTC